MMLIPAHIQEHFELAEKFDLEYKQVVAPYFKGEGKQTLNPNLETHFRRSVIAIIKNEKDNTYLCVDCSSRICRSFVLGGIEGEETPEEAGNQGNQRRNRISRCNYYKDKHISIAQSFFC